MINGIPVCHYKKTIPLIIKILLTHLYIFYFLFIYIYLYYTFKIWFCKFAHPATPQKQMIRPLLQITHIYVTLF